MINFRVLRHLWLFLAVAEERHFGKAAKRLGMSQPPLTKQIQVLEHALKVRLFERSQSGVTLTAAGLAILPAVQKFAEQVQRLELSVREATGGHTTVLTVGTITSAMFDVLPEIIERVKKDHPGITVSLKEADTASAIAALESGDMDVAFVRLNGSYGAVTAVPLITDRLAVALPSGHKLAGHKSIKLADVSEENFVLFPRSISPAYFDDVVIACRGAGFSPRILHEAMSVASQLAFVACGQGVAIVPSALKHMNTTGVSIKPLRDAVDVVTIAVAWNKHRPNPSVDALVKIAQSWAKR
jgi:DNA-binding transcriptional LysR family regulator